MKGYKWTTKDMRAFYDGYQYKFGWNEQDGVADGRVCVAGGFHITEEKGKCWLAEDSKFYNPSELHHCYEVYYRKRDILGKSPEGKMRVRAFKILRKRPVSIQTIAFRGNTTSYYYDTMYTGTSAIGSVQTFQIRIY